MEPFSERKYFQAFQNSGHWFSSMGFFGKIARIYLKKQQVARFLGMACETG